MDFSLLYFANRVVEDAGAEYGLLEQASRFADENGFTAVWLPERHFHPFGGAYPNPAVMAAALARGTRRVRLRAGSVVAPLHDPLEIVENWAMVDNLSGGRVDLAFASGWVADDFVLAPDRYAERREVTFSAIDDVRRAWAGERLDRINGLGEQVSVRAYPQPLQSAPGLWMTAAASVETFERAGAAGLNVLTALLFQGVPELAGKVRSYRRAREEAGFDPATGIVTLMLHTLVGADDDQVRAVVQKPFQDYLRSSMDLWRRQWPDMAAGNEEMVVAVAFRRYFRTAALFGSVAKCVEFAQRLAKAGVDEIACLVDFGVDADQLLAGLPYLKQVADEVGCACPGRTPRTRRDSDVG